VVTGTLTATVLPTDAADKSVDWSNLDPTIATIAWSGLSATVTAVAPGQTTVAVASVSDPSKKDECVVTVLPARPAVGAARSTFAAGSNHSLAIDAGGGLWVWGYNGDGQLGLGNYDNRLNPTRIGMGSDWAAVSSRGNHTAALKTDGSLWVWGNNNFGQMGLGDWGPDTRRIVPTRVGECGVPTGLARRVVWRGSGKRGGRRGSAGIFGERILSVSLARAS
jgi:hypothetical protein